MFTLCFNYIVIWMQADLDFKKLTVSLTFNGDAEHQVHSISRDSLLVHVLQRCRKIHERSKKSRGGGERVKNRTCGRVTGRESEGTKSALRPFLASSLQFNQSEYIRINQSGKDLLINYREWKWSRKHPIIKQQHSIGITPTINHKN